MNDNQIIFSSQSFPCFSHFPSFDNVTPSLIGLIDLSPFFLSSIKYYIPHYSRNYIITLTQCKKIMPEGVKQKTKSVEVNSKLLWFCLPDEDLGVFSASVSSSHIFSKAYKGECGMVD